MIIFRVFCFRIVIYLFNLFPLLRRKIEFNIKRIIQKLLIRLFCIDY